MALKLNKEKKDIYTLSADPWGQYELESYNLKHVCISGLHGVQCRNNDNYDAIREKCSQIVKLIDEIEQLNK